MKRAPLRTATRCSSPRSGPLVIAPHLIKGVPVRRAEGFRSAHRRGAGAERASRARGVAAQVASPTWSPHLKKEPGQDELRVLGQRLVRPPHRGAASGSRPAPRGCTFPTRAARRRSTTCSAARSRPRSRTSTPWSSTSTRGKLRALGVTVDRRSPLLPQVPTHGRGGRQGRRSSTSWQGGRRSQGPARRRCTVEAAFSASSPRSTTTQVKPQARRTAASRSSPTRPSSSRYSRQPSSRAGSSVIEVRQDHRRLNRGTPSPWSPRSSRHDARHPGRGPRRHAAEPQRRARRRSSPATSSILTDSAGHTGVGEVPGGEKIRQTLEDARALVVGQPRRRPAARSCRTMRSRFADRDAGGRGLQTFDLRTTIHAVTAVESALLDLLGPAPRRAGRGAARRRPAARRGARCWATSSSSATARKTDLPYAGEPDADGRLAAAAPREGADAGGDRAPRRGRAGALRLQRLQAEGRRAARRGGGRGGRRRCTSASRRRASRSTPTAAGC